MKHLIRLFLLSALVLALPGNVAAGTDTKLIIDNTGKLDLSAYRGKVIYLDFWASWCKPCRQSFSWMNKMRERYHDDGLIIIAVNLDTDQKLAKSFLKKVPAKFSIAYDPDGVTAQAYELKAMPSSFLIDRKGKYVDSALGFNGSKKKRIETKIRKLLGQPVLASR